MLSSPTSAALLEPIERKARTILGVGVTTVALHDSDKHALIITTPQVAQKIDALMALTKGVLSPSKGIISYHRFEENQALYELINPSNPTLAKKECALKKDFNASLAKKNVVYRAPRFMGDLETFIKMRFNFADLTKLRSQINNALGYLHGHDYTHNDVAFRNIFFKVSYDETDQDKLYPIYDFVLADYGSIVKNKSAITHGKKKNQDKIRLERVIEELRKKITPESKETIKKVQKTLEGRFLSEEEEKEAGKPVSPAKRKKPDSQVQGVSPITFFYATRKGSTPLTQNERPAPKSRKKLFG